MSQGSLKVPSYPGAVYDLKNDYGLSELEYKALRSITVNAIKMTEIEDLGVTRSNFIRIYESLKERVEKENKIPLQLRNDNYKQLSQENSQKNKLEENKIGPLKLIK
jgi:hypothetical protein